MFNSNTKCILQNGQKIQHLITTIINATYTNKGFVLFLIKPFFIYFLLVEPHNHTLCSILITLLYTVIKSSQLKRRCCITYQKTKNQIIKADFSLTVTWKMQRRKRQLHLHQSSFSVIFQWLKTQHRQDCFTVWDKMHIILYRAAPAIRGLISSGILIQYWVLQTFDNVLCELKFHFSISSSSAPPEINTCRLVTGRIWPDKTTVESSH